MKKYIYNVLLCITALLSAMALTACNPIIPQVEEAASTETQTPLPATSIPVQLTDEPLPSYVVYLRDNSIPLSHLSNYDSMNERFSEYRITLAGETHGVKKSFDAELMLLKYLYETQNIRCILLEVGYSSGELLNEYINTGNKSIIETVMKNLEGTSAYSDEYYFFFRDIAEYNKGLDDNAKLRLFGVDVQHQFFTGVYFLKGLFPPKIVPPDEISAPLTKLLKKTAYTYTTTDFSELETSVQENKDIYRDLLGDEVFSRFIKAIDGTRQGIEWNTSSDGEFREKCLRDNTTAVIEAYCDERFYGVFGSFHTSMAEFNGNEPSLANYLNNEYMETSDKVAAITFLYHNSKYRSSQGVGQVGEYDIIKEAAPFLHSDISICPIDLPKSPFDVAEGYSTKSQEYLVIIVDSPETSIYYSENNN